MTKHVGTHQRTLSLTLLVAGFLLTSGLVSVRARLPDPTALVRITTYDDRDLTFLDASGVPIFARLPSGGGPSFLAGATPAQVTELQSAGLSVDVADPNFQEQGYYLAYQLPSRPSPQWASYGHLLLDDNDLALLHTTFQDAARLAQTGVEVPALTLDPKPVHQAAARSDFSASTDPDPMVQSMIDAVSSTAVQSYTGDLSGEWPVMIAGSSYTIATRHTYSGEPIEKATEYAQEHLEGLGLDVEVQQWNDSTYPNIIGEIRGLTRPEQVYILCAHIDDMPSGSLAPGADDNASGSAGVLIAADILSEYRWACTLRFALWTGEEQGLLGSQAYAHRASDAGEEILGVLNLDMIAYNGPGSSPAIELHANAGMPSTLQLAQLFSGVVGAYDLDLEPEIVEHGTGASDHASFWDYGYTAILGIEDFQDFNPRYHTTGDQLQYLDIPYMTDFVRASLATFVHMSDCLLRATYLPVVARDG